MTLLELAAAEEKVLRAFVESMVAWVIEEVLQASRAGAD